MYARIFEPGGKTPRYRNLPRPFVLRAEHLNGETFEPGQELEFQMNLFDRSIEVRDAVRGALSGLRELGAHRSRVTLTDFSCAEHCVDLNPHETPVSRIRIDFRTPTELKTNNIVIDRPEFPVLFARCAERVAALSGLKLDISLSPRVELIGYSGHESFAERRSSKTGQRHRIGGFVGHAIYDGDLRMCVPVLKAAEFTGVGRHTSWGNGRISVSLLA